MLWMDDREGGDQHQKRLMVLAHLTTTRSDAHWRLLDKAVVLVPSDRRYRCMQSQTSTATAASLMELQRPGFSDLLILLLLLVVVMAEPGFAFKLEADSTISHFPPLIDCGPASVAPSGAFHANILSLLGALPSAAAAAAPTGFAAALSRGAGRDRAFARGLCFGASRRGSSPPTADGDCLTCLSAAAMDVATKCHGRRRGGTWRAGCFLSFADTNATSSREDAFRGWFYDDDDDATPNPTAALVSQCTGDRAASECSRCLKKSARVVRELRRRRRLSRIHGDSVVVVGYGCVLRVVLVSPPPQWQINFYGIRFIVEMVIIVVAGACGIRYCIRRVLEFLVANVHQESHRW